MRVDHNLRGAREFLSFDFASQSGEFVSGWLRGVCVLMHFESRPRGLSKRNHFDAQAGVKDLELLGGTSARQIKTGSVSVTF